MRFFASVIGLSNGFLIFSGSVNSWRGFRDLDVGSRNVKIGVMLRNAILGSDSLLWDSTLR